MSLFAKSRFNPIQSSPPCQRILLVDRDAEDLEYFAAWLEQMGYSVRAFTNYREAAWCLQHACFDLVLVGQNGGALETRRLLKFTLGHERYTPVVVLARSLEINCYFEAIELGASDCLEKPRTPAEFERVLTKHCPPRRSQVSARPA